MVKTFKLNDIKVLMLTVTRNLNIHDVIIFVIKRAGTLFFLKRSSAKSVTDKTRSSPPAIPVYLQSFQRYNMSFNFLIISYSNQTMGQQIIKLAHDGYLKTRILNRVRFYYSSFQRDIK